MNGQQKNDFQFLKQIVLTSLVVVFLTAYPLTEYATKEIFNASVTGFILSLANVLLGYAAIEFSANKSYSAFVQIVLGGIAVRLMVMGGALLVLIWLVKMHAIGLVVSLFVMYVIFLGLEIFYIHNKWQTKIQQ